jgi:hypothetical protein
MATIQFFPLLHQQVVVMVVLIMNLVNSLAALAALAAVDREMKATLLLEDLAPLERVTMGEELALEVRSLLGVVAVAVAPELQANP